MSFVTAARARGAGGRSMARQPMFPALALALAACGPAVGGYSAEPVAETPLALAEREAARRVAEERSIDAATLPRRSVGVAPFRVAFADTSLSSLGHGLADLLMTDLARSGQLEVVDRLRLDAVLRELRLAESGRVDSATAPRLGRIVGARTLVLGAIGDRPDRRLTLDAQVADVPSGTLRSAGSAAVSADDILRAEKELALRLFDRLGVTLTPAERRAVEELPTRNLKALLAYSRATRYAAEGRYDLATREYRAALEADSDFDLAGERLRSVQQETGQPASPSTAPEQLGRAAAHVVDRVNAPPAPPIASLPTRSITDPSTEGGGGGPPGGTATIIIIVTPDR
jgi:TolB-like protein